MIVLVIAAHPDDEAIGLGGTILKHTRSGSEVHTVFLTNGEQGRGGEDPEGTAELRMQEAKDASAILGTTSLRFFGEPDGALARDRRVAAGLLDVIAELAPDRIYTPSAADAHGDHRAATEILREALWLRKKDPYAGEIWMYEIWTPLDRVDHVEDITLSMGEKISAIRAHRSQCDRMRFDEAAYALARYRGEMHGRPGGPFAEVFAEIGTS